MELEGHMNNSSTAERQTKTIVSRYFKVILKYLAILPYTGHYF